MFTQRIILDLVILGIFAAAIYAFLILPRQREFKRRQRVVAAIEPGARVTTYGGIIGVVKRIDLERGLATVEIADGVEVRMLAAAIMGEFEREAVAESAQKALDDR